MKKDKDIVSCIQNKDSILVEIENLQGKTRDELESICKEHCTQNTDECFKETNEYPELLN